MRTGLAGGRQRHTHRGADPPWRDELRVAACPDQGLPGATGVLHGTMTHITGRCGRHRHNGSDTGKRGLPGQRAGPRDNDPCHGAVWQTPVQRSGTARQTDHGTLTGHTAQQPARTGQLAVLGTVARHSTSPRQGTRPRLPDICPGESGLFARRQGQNPVLALPFH